MAEKPQGITAIKVEGFKSLYEMKEPITIRPLTLLAGANSSGKSSVMQPLLLMKQTLEASYEPGTFRLNGSNANFTNADEFLSKYKPTDGQQLIRGDFTVELILKSGEKLSNVYGVMPSDDSFQTFLTTYEGYDTIVRLRQGLSHEELLKILPTYADKFRQNLEPLNQNQRISWAVVPNRCFLDLGLVVEERLLYGRTIPFPFFPIQFFSYTIQNIIHVPGLRGNPQRSYPTTRIDSRFTGTFEPYTATIIYDWAKSVDGRLSRLIEQVRLLNLASHVTAEPLNDAQLQILVARTLDTDDIDDMVNIADVGLGVSQVLPVLTALLVAEPEQLVYLEQPELHLHPRAQVKLAEIIADAAKRGVRVVVETHSSLLLLGIQTLIAENKLNHEDVILHWFKRGDDGKTTVTSVEPDENGAYGEWPEDFADVELKAQMDYLDAVATREVVE
jgi:hypothetical protein